MTCPPSVLIADAQRLQQQAGLHPQHVGPRHFQMGALEPQGLPGLPGALVPGDVLFVKGSGGLVELGTAGGLLGHVMLVAEPPRQVIHDSDEGRWLEPVWPKGHRPQGPAAEEVWRLSTVESTRSHNGLHEADVLLHVDRRTRKLILIGEIIGSHVEICGEVAELWQTPEELQSLLNSRLLREVLGEMRAQSASWSWATAARAVLRSADTFGDHGDKRQLLREITECWASDPICTSVVIGFWQRCLCRLAAAGVPVGGQRPDPADLVLRWMPIKADRSLPGTLLETMKRCGWIQKLTIPVGASRRGVQRGGSLAHPRPQTVTF